MAGDGNLVHIGLAAIVAALEATLLDIRENLRPDLLGFTGHDGIGGAHGLVGAHGRMNAAHDDGHAEPAEERRHFVGAVRLRRDGGDAHEVGTGQGGVVG